MAWSIVLSFGWYLVNMVLLLYEKSEPFTPDGSGDTWGKAFPISRILAGWSRSKSEFLRKFWRKTGTNPAIPP
jgi:hypothetical protein